MPYAMIVIHFISTYVMNLQYIVIIFALDNYLLEEFFKWEKHLFLLMYLSFSLFFIVLQRPELSFGIIFFHAENIHLTFVKCSAGLLAMHFLSILILIFKGYFHWPLKPMLSPPSPTFKKYHSIILLLALSMIRSQRYFSSFPL